MAFGSNRVIIAYIGVWDIVMIVTDPCDRNQKEKQIVNTFVKP
jgi:hypothetical protein